MSLDLDFFEKNKKKKVMTHDFDFFEKNKKKKVMTLDFDFTLCFRFVNL
jgi:hypothetical protein